MHLHTAGNSRCAKVPAEKAAGLYSAAGYDAVVVTNHWNKNIAENYFGGSADRIDRYLNGYRAMKATGIKTLFGVELALGDDYYSLANRRGAEILVYGITPEEFAVYGESLYSNSYASLKELASEKGWLLYQAHPFRERTKRVAPEFLDGVEVFNGNRRHINLNGLASLYAEKQKLKKTAGSDFHQQGDVKAGVCFPYEPADEKALARALSAGDFKIFRSRRSLKKET